MIVIVQGGQTGVDRGAWRAARDAGVGRSGYMPRDQDDEYGPIPDDVKEGMEVCPFGGYAARTRDNVSSSDALVVVVRDVQRPHATPGTRLTLAEARRYHVMRRVVDNASPSTISCLVENLGLIAPFTQPRDRPLRVMVAGPRRSMWREGEDVAYQVVGALLERLKDAPNRAWSADQLPPAGDRAGCQTLEDGVTAGKDRPFGHCDECAPEFGCFATGVGCCKKTMNMIHDDESKIVIRYNTGWTGYAYVEHYPWTSCVDATDLATGKWHPNDVEQRVVTRATAMAAAAYVAWTLQSALETK